MTKILALDPATRCGWAYWEPGLPNPLSGTFELPSDAGELGRTGCLVHRNLNDLHKLHGFERVYYEQPIPPSQMMGNTQLLTIAKTFGIAAHIESYCYAKDIRCRYVPMGSWRRTFVGKGAGEKSKTFKEWAIDRCREIGWNPRSHDEADALGILDHAIGLDPALFPPWRDGSFMFRPFERKPR